MDASGRPDETLTLAELVESLHPVSRRAERLLLHDADGPNECLVRAGELVVTAEAAEPTMDRLRRWADRTDHLDDLRLVRIRLRPAEQERCVQIATEVCDDLEVAANHVHWGSPVLFGTPVPVGAGSRPVESEEPIAPPPGVWDPPVTVALLDTGLDPHPWFAARPWFSEWGHSPEVLDADGLSGQDRQAGHGTFVAGVLLQHAPGVTVRHCRALASTGFSDDLTVAAVMRRMRCSAARRGTHIDIVMLSAGCYSADDRCPPALARQVRSYAECVVVAAAGNGGGQRPFWPAALPEVLAVGACMANGSFAEFSNRGNWVDAAAPGVDVISSFVRLSTSDNVMGQDGESREYGAASWSGTSFAVPRVAAELAVQLHRGMTVQKAKAEACARFKVRDTCRYP